MKKSDLKQIIKECITQAISESKSEPLVYTVKQMVKHPSGHKDITPGIKCTLKDQVGDVVMLTPWNSGHEFITKVHNIILYSSYQRTQDMYSTYKKTPNQTNTSSKLNEESYTLYHPSFSSAASAAKEHAERQGYEISEDDWFREVSTSYPGRPRNGDTSKFHIPVTKNGKPQNRQLHFQVHDMQTGKYELNVYIQENRIQPMKRNIKNLATKIFMGDAVDSPLKIARNVRALSDDDLIRLNNSFIFSSDSRNWQKFQKDYISGEMQRRGLSNKSIYEAKTRSAEDKRRAAARREAEVKSGYKKPKGGAIPSGKEKAKEKDKKKGRKPVKD